MALIRLLLVPFLLYSCANNNKLTRSTPQDDFITTASGLKYKILQKGTGEPAKVGNEVLIFETTTYLDGTVLYSNENSKNAVKVLIGGNQATTAVDLGELIDKNKREVFNKIKPMIDEFPYPSSISNSLRYLSPENALYWSQQLAECGLETVVSLQDGEARNH
jgi:hypothetical protein